MITAWQMKQKSVQAKDEIITKYKLNEYIETELQSISNKLDIHNIYSSNRLEYNLNLHGLSKIVESEDFENASNALIETIVLRLESFGYKVLSFIDFEKRISSIDLIW